MVDENIGKPGGSPVPPCPMGFILPSGNRIYPGDSQYAGIKNAWEHGAPFDTFSICCTVRVVYAPF